MKTNSKLQVILAGYTSKNVPYYFIKAQDSNPLLQQYVAAQEEFLGRTLEKNSVSNMYPYFSNKAGFFGNQGVIELVTLTDGREMFLPDTKLSKRLYAEAQSIIDTLVKEGEIKAGTPAKIEVAKLHMELLKGETGDAYAWPARVDAVVESNEDSAIDKF
jgi:hypothetical protein